MSEDDTTTDALVYSTIGITVLFTGYMILCCYTNRSRKTTGTIAMEGVYTEEGVFEFEEDVEEVYEVWEPDGYGGMQQKEIVVVPSPLRPPVPVVSDLRVAHGEFDAQYENESDAGDEAESDSQRRTMEFSPGIRRTGSLEIVGVSVPAVEVEGERRPSVVILQRGHEPFLPPQPHHPNAYSDDYDAENPRSPRSPATETKFSSPEEHPERRSPGPTRANPGSSQNPAYPRRPQSRGTTALMVSL